jgi:hypothetical protein
MNLKDIFMELKGFRKLDMDLPRQPLSNQKMWFVAGLLLASSIMFLAVFEYLRQA